eukprot:CAMPEP_0201621424 /NCGR_PEP_ID=MMETSP0492-20130828/46806_1 /ASSEMBLY_ACC=CAM_ASM_000837 /TAXON_ID=420259 /ORGANISM="Thalassiosira gravida, Strain GMp14c1" /LENGTH=160 /DNA_ID=CAMNT_0048090945 /DNA_START=164 /DNA_END=646 /DNA_ORIENTATION=-
MNRPYLRCVLPEALLRHRTNTASRPVMFEHLLVLNLGCKETNARTQDCPHTPNTNEKVINTPKIPTGKSRSVDDDRAHDTKHEEDESVVGTQVLITEEEGGNGWHQTVAGAPQRIQRTHANSKGELAVHGQRVHQQHGRGEVGSELQRFEVADAIGDGSP